MTVTISWKTALDLAILVFALIGMGATAWLIPAFLRGFRVARTQRRAEKARRVSPK